MTERDDSEVWAYMLALSSIKRIVSNLLRAAIWFSRVLRRWTVRDAAAPEGELVFIGDETPPGGAEVRYEAADALPLDSRYAMLAGRLDSWTGGGPELDTHESI